MSRKKSKPDVSIDDADDAAATGARASPLIGNNTGRVKFDERGNAVWEWAVATGKFEADATNTRLKKLASPDLSIDDTVPVATPTAPATVAKENRKGVTQGYSPYDSGLLVKAQAEAKASKKKDLRRLSEWVKLREQFNRKKHDQD